VTGDVAFELRDAAVARGGRTIWSGATMRVPAGAVVGVIGPNGSGKSTLLGVLLGQLPLSEGRAEVLGQPPRRGNSAIGYVPQHYSSEEDDALRGIDLVTLGITARRWGLRRTPHAADQAREALARVGALDVAERRLSELSGGEQQRVAIATSLTDDPRLLLLDEPLANLDMASQHDIVALLGTLAAGPDLSMVLVTHNPGEVLPLLDGVIYLLDGHAHYDTVEHVIDEALLTAIYRAPVSVVRTPGGDVFTSVR
jgi:zinc/manganese transport system ATP-binding protein